MRAAPRSPRGRSNAAPTPRPAAVLSRAPLAPLPGATSPAPRLPLGLGPSPGRRQVCPWPLGPATAALLQHTGPGRAGRRGGRAGGPAARRAGPEGAPPRLACAGRRSSRAARRAAPRASTALLPRCRLHARSQPATDSAFSCQRIALEPPRLLRKKKKKGNNSPAVSGAAPSPSSAPGVRSRPGKGRARRGAPGPHLRCPCAPRVPSARSSARARIPYF